MPLNPGQSAAKTAEEHNVKITAAISMLCKQWDLGLPLPRPDDSPSQRQRSDEGRCVFLFKYLQYRNRLSAATARFDREALILYRGWVHKPRAERGHIPPVTRDRARPVNESERLELLRCLLAILEEEYKNVPPTPSTRMISARKAEGLDDSPIASSFPKSNKRASGDHFEDIEKGAKKQKPHDVRKSSRESNSNVMPPPSPPKTRRRLDPDVSFASTFSGASVFSAPSFRNFGGTQTTIPDDESLIPTQTNTWPPSPCVGHTLSSDYGSSSFDQHVKDSFDPGHSLDIEKSQDPEDNESFEQQDDSVVEIQNFSPIAKDIYGHLELVFPETPKTLEHLPFPVLYEVTRVALHAELPLSAFNAIKYTDWKDHNTFWSYLKQLSCMKGKTLPDGSSITAWNKAMDDSFKEQTVVCFSGSLAYTKLEEGLFKFRLEPMRLDKSHRLDRSFGSNRFFELDLPQLSGKNTPLDKLGEESLHVITSWLVDGVHRLISRTWKPFHVKPKERRARKWVRSRAEGEFDTENRVYFFAISEPQSPPAMRVQGQGEIPQAVNIRQLLNFIRPTRQNMDEKYLKLFVRTDLAVSRNTATILLDSSQIIFQTDIKFKGEVMTDGAGQISRQLAEAVADKLGLTFVPSGFQARIGEAKGFWSVDNQDKSETTWIKILGSQRKWKTKSKVGIASHESQRTFEVLRYSSPLKAADLNMQLLPILQDRAIDPKAMTACLIDLLNDGLDYKLVELEKAIENPQTYRAWLLQRASGTSERRKNMCVPYRAGLPTTIDERQILLLDAGFQPQQQAFLGDLMQKTFKAECDELKKRLNITVNKSTYVYMVPDFSEVLDEGEVFINFSKFIDKTSKFQNAKPLLSGVDILVARSPSHYISDIQKVRAVFKPELIGLEDVIVFSTKGNPSLAAKLSGGDYDGDIAWVCWEPSIVDNFQNADIPDVPDLVKESLIEQNTVTYRELVEGKSNPTSTFLNASLRFNLQPKMLGRCTNFKEEMCYTIRSVSSTKAIYMSTLLSYLVDQAKQGYIFTLKHWERFKTANINIFTRVPSYKTDQVDKKSNHILDQLSLATEIKVDAALTTLYQIARIGAVSWDCDLVKPIEHAKEMARKELLQDGPRLYTLLVDDLNSDLKALKENWPLTSAGTDDDRSNGFLSKIDAFYQQLVAIRPHSDNALTRSLLPEYMAEESTPWALLRASALFAIYGKRRKDPSYVVWNLVGRQLAKIKAECGGTGFSHAVVPGMYWFLKPDGAMVRQVVQQEKEFDDNISVVNADEIADLED